MKNKLLIIALTLIGLLLGCFVGSYIQLRADKPKLIADTITTTIIDTIPYYEPVAVDSVVVRYISVNVPITNLNEVQVSTNAETAILTNDSVQIELPITQKHYADSTYDAWVSGYAAALDSIKVYNKVEQIIITQSQKRKRWGIGIQGGYGFTTNRAQPYIGIGISYNLISF